jgi:hypothetical protein
MCGPVRTGDACGRMPENYGLLDFMPRRGSPAGLVLGRANCAGRAMTGSELCLQPI